MGFTDTYRCCTCGGTLCEVAIFCYNKFGSGGYLWLSNSYTVTVAWLVGSFPDCLQLYWVLHWFDL